jgi:hypothetical protein
LLIFIIKKLIISAVVVSSSVVRTAAMLAGHPVSSPGHTNSHPTYTLVTQLLVGTEVEVGE